MEPPYKLCWFSEIGNKNFEVPLEVFSYRFQVSCSPFWLHGINACNMGQRKLSLRGIKKLRGKCREQYKGRISDEPEFHMKLY